MPSQWDHAADKGLLLSIIELGALSKIDWHSVSANVRSKGYEFTHEACRQHYQKIRKESRNAVPGNGTSAPSTPASQRKKGSVSKARGGGLGQTPTNHRDDSEELALPATKKRKRAETEKKKEENLSGFEDLYNQDAMMFKNEYQPGDPPIIVDDDEYYEN